MKCGLYGAEVKEQPKITARAFRWFLQKPQIRNVCGLMKKGQGLFEWKNTCMMLPEKARYSSLFMNSLALSMS